MHWYIDGFKNFGNFDGRARRKEYWMFVLFNFLVSLAISLLEFAIPSMVYLRLIYGLAVLIPGLSLSVRRLHDIGKSGWYNLIVFIPLIGAIWLLILMCTDSDPGSNQYGPNPKIQNEAVNYESNY